MSLDLEQFHDAFFEESFEALETMEASLLKLDPGSVAPDLINTIFRVAHSIKGGSAMFGFSDITSFTHTLETLLDELRSNRMEITQQISDQLLKSVDVLRDMLRNVQAKQPVDVQRVSDLQFDLELLVAQRGQAADLTGTPPLVPNTPWCIDFRPGAQLLLRGNEPLRILAELAEHGSVETQACIDALPPLPEMDPEVCYITWRLTVDATVTREQIDETFEWALGDCDLDVCAAVADAERPSAAAVAAGVAPPARKSAGELEPAMQAASPASVTADTPAVSAAPKPVAGDAPAAAETRPPPADAGSIRVGIEKVDELLNSVGEVVITQSMLMQIGLKLEGPLTEQLRSGLSQLERNVRELQESVMRVRMLPISFVFNRLPRMVRDLGRKLGKRVELKMIGEHTELDKTVLEKIGDPLVHLVRNSIDHGIELPDDRAAAGKSETGTITLTAYHKGGNIIVEVSDDGGGLNRERILAKARERGLVAPDEEPSEERIYNLIFQPGFSTAAQVSDVSGRGVGMDVVRRNIIELGGHVQIMSAEGLGSTVRVRLPLTLAILDGQLIRVGGETFVVPLVSIVETIQVARDQINFVAGSMEVLRMRSESIPIIRLRDVFGVASDSIARGKRLVMIVEADGQRAGIVVDELLAQQQVVIKSLETNFRQLAGISGATMLGDGRVALILDVPGLLACFENAMTMPAQTSQET